MELKELFESTLSMFEVKSVDELKNALMAACYDAKKLKEFKTMVSDLSVDWLQMIFQYYAADRKIKKQDYTPKTLAMFLGKLVGDYGTVVDLCAGSGALTIQKWSENHDIKFELYEIDENVIPYLCFNMVLRNIECKVTLGDVLQDEAKKIWVISKGEEFGIITEVEK